MGLFPLSMFPIEGACCHHALKLAHIFSCSIVQYHMPSLRVIILAGGSKPSSRGLLLGVLCGVLGHVWQFLGSLTPILRNHQQNKSWFSWILNEQKALILGFWDFGGSKSTKSCISKTRRSNRSSTGMLHASNASFTQRGGQTGQGAGPADGKKSFKNCRTQSCAICKTRALFLSTKYIGSI